MAKAAVVVFPGSNCDRDCKTAIERSTGATDFCARNHPPVATSASPMAPSTPASASSIW